MTDIDYEILVDVIDSVIAVDVEFIGLVAVEYYYVVVDQQRHCFVRRIIDVFMPTFEEQDKAVSEPSYVVVFSI